MYRPAGHGLILRLLCLVGSVLFARNVLTAGEVIDTPDYFIQTIGIPDGLPHQLAHRLVQDKTGFLWISTSGGLARYDGNRIQSFASPLLSTRESDVICAITRGDDGNLWAAPNCGGLVRYDPDSGSFTAHAAAAGFPSGLLAFVTQSTDGAIWAGYFSGRLQRWKNGKSTWFTNNFAVNQTLSVATDGAGRTWVASDDLLAYYDKDLLIPYPEKVGTRLCLGTGRTGTVWVASTEHLDKLDDGKLVRFADDPPWMSRANDPPWVSGAGRVSVVFQEDNGTLWIGTKGQGLFRIEDDKFKHVPTSHPWITDITQDTEGNVWVATRGGGVNRVRKKPFHFWQSKSDLLASGITSVCEDALGNIWVASTGGGLIQFSKGKLFRHREFRDDLLTGIQVICPDQSGHLWIGTRMGLLRWDPAQEPRPEVVVTNRVIHALFSRRNGEMWAGGQGFVGRCRGGQWEDFPVLQTIYSNSLVRCMGEDIDGVLWMALNTGELLQYRNGFAPDTNAAALHLSVVRCIFSDSAGNLWMGTTRDGLLLHKGGRFYRISTEQGWLGEAIDGILEDDAGLLWFGSQSGLYHVPREQLMECALGKIPKIAPIPYGRGAGLVGYSLNSGFQPVLWKSRTGEFWLATHRGLIGFDPAMAALNTHRSPILIDEISLDDRPVAVRNPLTLPTTTKKLEVRLSVIDFSAPDQVKIQHRLEGFDSAWVEAGNERSFAYPKLPPGDYRLFVRACNADGVWNESATPLLLTVTPAWWQLRWLQVVGFSLAVVLLVASVRSWSHRRLQRKLGLLEQKQAMEKERARIAKNLHDDLGASLTEIGLLADLARRNGNGNGNGAANEASRDVHRFFSERVRGLARTLDNIVWTVNPKNDSLDELATYLCEFSQELFRMSSIRCRLDVDGEIPHYRLTPEERSNIFLAAKEAINNIVKHSGATEAFLGIGMEGDTFRIRIKDNGRGFNPAAAENGKRNGLANMRSRIRELNGIFSLDSAPGEGAAVSISVRIVPKDTSSGDSAPSAHVKS